MDNQVVDNQVVDNQVVDNQVDSILLDSANDDFVDCSSSCCDWDNTPEHPCPGIFKIRFWYGSWLELNYSSTFDTYCYQLWFKHKLIYLVDSLEEW